jgi:hypothetical protein
MLQPWLCTEIKEQRHWDITAEERLNILRDFVRFGLIHWGSDSKGTISSCSVRNVHDVFISIIYFYCVEVVSAVSKLSVKYF